MPNTANSGGPGSYHATGPAEDPLLGLPRPRGNVDALREAGRTYQAAGPAFGALRHQLRSCVGGVVGTAWIGRAGETCEQASESLASSYGELGAQADYCQEALLTCATRWSGALEQYARARQLADQALSDEEQRRVELYTQAEQHRATGDEYAARLDEWNAGSYVSQNLRDAARRNAQEAIQTFDQATWKAARDLDGLLMPTAAVLNTVAGVLGRTATYGDAATKATRAHHLNAPTTLAGGNPRVIGRLGRLSAIVKGAGVAAGVAQALVSGHERWYVDQLKYRDMDTPERTARAVAEGVSIAFPSGVIGSLAGSAVGYISWVGGPAGVVFAVAVGAGVGSAAGTWLDNHNDPWVDAMGNVTDTIAYWAEWGADRLSGLGPWD